MIKFSIITLYPEAFPGTLGVSIPNQELGKNWQLNVINLRIFGIGEHKQVDDDVYGGGSGMLIRPDVLSNAIEEAVVASNNPITLAMSPRGFKYNQKTATGIANSNRDIIIICGRFEGIDYRLIEYYNIAEFSIGDFVLFGGEAAAMCIIESILRLKEGFCGNLSSINEESFSVGTEFENLMEYPHYTRPAFWNNSYVPDVLKSGNHLHIKEWRLSQAKKFTRSYKIKQFRMDNVL